MNEFVCRVGLIGAGTVGGGVIKILQERVALMQRRSGVRIELTKVFSRTPGKISAAGVADTKIANHYRDLVNDPELDIIVELIGGLDPAFTIVDESLAAGKAVVTANKALLAERGKELFRRASANRVPLAFEAAVAGGIPIVLALREGLVANQITSLRGIVNGTCNFILSKMSGEGAAYDEVLREAQALGYAEADPTFDVEGIDSGHKLALLSALAFETWVDFPTLSIEGISQLEIMDLAFAQELGYTVKHLAVAKVCEDETLSLSVHPALLPSRHPLANVQGSMNAVAVEGDVAGESMFYGHGAGRDPTASAVVADILKTARELRLRNGNGEGNGNGNAASFWEPETTPHYKIAPLDEYRTRYYLRFSVNDEPGVLGKLTTALGAHNNSIALVHQHSNQDTGTAIPVVVLTHETREGDIRAALAEIQAAGLVGAPPVCIRLEA